MRKVIPTARLTYDRKQHQIKVQFTYDSGLYKICGGFSGSFHNHIERAWYIPYKYKDSLINKIKSYGSKLDLDPRLETRKTNKKVIDNSIRVLIDNTNELIYIVSDQYDPSLIVTLNRVPETKPLNSNSVLYADKMVYTAPKSTAILLYDVLKKVDGVTFDESFMNFYNIHQRLIAINGNDDLKGFNVGSYQLSLMPFQTSDVRFTTSRRGRVIIGNDMGTGKTHVALGYAEASTERPMIVVAPSTAVTKWRDEINKGLSKKKATLILSGRTPKNLRKYENSYDVFIVSWHVLQYWEKEIIKIKPMILIGDEAHYIKNKGTIRYKSFKAISEKSKRCLLLTGTPIKNKPAELWTLLNIIAKPEWPSEYEFRLRYGSSSRDAANLDELYQRIKPYMTRRKLVDVAPQLPRIIREILVIPSSEFDMNDYQKSVDSFKKSMEALLNTGAKLPYIKAIAEIEKLKQKAVKLKSKFVIDWISEFLQNSDKKLVVFAHHNFFLDRLMKRFSGISVKIDGSISAENRGKAVDMFNNDNNIRLFVGGINSASEGIDLVAANNVLITELPWTPSAVKQAEARLTRIFGSNGKPVYSTIAVLENSIETGILSLLSLKAGMINSVVDGEFGDDFGGKDIYENVVYGVMKGDF